MPESSRIAKTKKSLKDALILLMVNTSISKITVKTVCDAADVNRATFYTYYGSIGDLLDAAEEDLVKDLEVFNEPKPEGLDSLTDFFICLFSKIKEHAFRTRTLLVITDSRTFTSRLYRQFDKINLAGYLQAITDSPRKLKFSAGGIIAIISEWILNDFEAPVENLAELATKMLEAVRDVNIG